MHCKAYLIGKKPEIPGSISHSSLEDKRILSAGRYRDSNSSNQIDMVLRGKGMGVRCYRLWWTSEIHG